MQAITKLLAFCYLLLLTIPPVHAKTVVLVHGMLSDEQEWFKSGIAQSLIKSGWQYKGNLPFANPKLQPFQNYSHSLSNDQPAFYTLRLNWYLPIAEQSAALKAYVEKISEHRKEQIILIGHSLGGVVARHYLINAHKNQPTLPIKHLITIASPHLGTPWAWMVWQTLQTPAKMFLTPVSPIPLSQAEQVLFEISNFPKRNLIHQMAVMEHPNIQYTSIIHEMKMSEAKVDLFVSPDSQNMNHLHALSGKSTHYSIASQHGLSLKDALLLLKIFDLNI